MTASLAPLRLTDEESTLLDTWLTDLLRPEPPPPEEDSKKTTMPPPPPPNHIVDPAYLDSSAERVLPEPPLRLRPRPKPPAAVPPPQAGLAVSPRIRWEKLKQKARAEGALGGVVLRLERWQKNGKNTPLPNVALSAFPGGGTYPELVALLRGHLGKDDEGRFIVDWFQKASSSSSSSSSARLACLGSLCICFSRKKPAP